MNLYLTKLTSIADPTIPPRYKTGETKWGQHNIVSKRFRFNDDFDGLDVELLAVKYVQHDDPREARRMVQALETKIFTVIPKKEINKYDNIEEHFNITPRPESFGCTEFHHKELGLTQEQLIEKWIKTVGGRRYVKEA